MFFPLSTQSFYFCVQPLLCQWQRLQAVVDPMSGEQGPMRIISFIEEIEIIEIISTTPWALGYTQ